MRGLGFAAGQSNADDRAPYVLHVERPGERLDDCSPEVERATILARSKQVSSGTDGEVVAASDWRTVHRRVTTGREHQHRGRDERGDHSRRKAVTPGSAATGIQTGTRGSIRKA